MIPGMELPTPPLTKRKRTTEGKDHFHICASFLRPLPSLDKIPPFRLNLEFQRDPFDPNQNCRFHFVSCSSFSILFGTIQELRKQRTRTASYKFIHNKMGGVLGRSESPSSNAPESKLEAKMVEAMQQRASEGTSMKSFNSIIMKFPRIDESFRKCKTIFEQFDEDSNGAIDPEELKRCFEKLEISFKEEELDALFLACDINENMGMKFNEFIVLLCLVHLLKEPAADEAKSRMGLENLEATFETLVDAFVFLDKNKDGYVSKSEMVQAINETTSGERSSGRIAMKRFEEMDWDKNGMVTFKEFLFAFTSWVGIDDVEEDDGST